MYSITYLLLLQGLCILVHVNLWRFMSGNADCLGQFRDVPFRAIVTPETLVYTNCLTVRMNVTFQALTTPVLCACRLLVGAGMPHSGYFVDICI